MHDTRLTEQLHLLLGSTHEQEARGVQQERREVLEAVRVGAAHANIGFITQDKRDLDDTSEARRHQGVTKDTVDHSADHQRLCVRRHGITSQTDDNSRNQVPLGPAITAAAQPHAQKTSAPPDDTHRSMLEIIVDPGSAPAVFSKGINAAPRGDNQRVEEFLAPARAAQPVLAHQQQNSQANTIADESAAHDKMRETLSHMVTLAEAQSRNTTEQHLRPAQDRHDLADDTMRQNENPSDAALASLFQMELQVDSEHNLHDQ